MIRNSRVAIILCVDFTQKNSENDSGSSEKCSEAPTIFVGVFCFV